MTAEGYLTSLLQTQIDAKVGKGEQVFFPQDFGAIGDGVTDDTVPVLAAFAAANALVRDGIVSTIKAPGATVVLRGRYNLASLSSFVDARCNVLSLGAALHIPAAYSGIGLSLGHTTSGSILQNVHAVLPDVVKPTNSLIVASSTGVRLINLYNSKAQLGRTSYWDSGMWVTGLGEGTAYCEIHPGYVSYCTVGHLLKPGSGGWANQNTFIAGGIQQSSGYAGGNRITGWRHLVLDQNAAGGGTAITGNSFIGVSYEGDVSEYNTLLSGTVYQNQWIGCRYEQGPTQVSVTFTGGGSSTITRTAHGLSVGDQVVFSASSTPGGLFILIPYYVISTPTADTFTVARKKGGTALTFSSAGSGVIMFRSAIINIGNGATNNRWRSPCVPVGSMDIRETGASSYGNIFDQPSGNSAQMVDAYADADRPLIQTRNRVTGTYRPHLACYATGVNPATDPDGWVTGVSDRGFQWGDAAGNEVGRLLNPLGIMTYQRPGEVGYEIATGRRTPSLITISALSCAANTTTTSTFSMSDVAVNDHVLITMTSAPAGTE